jgi:rRNA maturation endonuclease Nob1
MEILSRQVGPYTLLQWIIGLAVVYVLVTVLQKVFKKATAKPDKDFVAMRCAGCGWVGKVSRFHRTCPKCGDNITRTDARIPSL